MRFCGGRAALGGALLLLALLLPPPARAQDESPPIIATYDPAQATARRGVASRAPPRSALEACSSNAQCSAFRSHCAVASNNLPPLLQGATVSSNSNIRFTFKDQTTSVNENIQ